MLITDFKNKTTMSSYKIKNKETKTNKSVSTFGENIIDTNYEKKIERQYHLNKFLNY